MNIIVATDREQLGRYVAEQATEILKQSLRAQALVNLVVATGASQFEVLNYLSAKKEVDWNRVCGYHLDEYLGISLDHPASFCRYLKERFADNLPLASFYYLDGMLPPEQLRLYACKELANKKIDLMLCGIGENGHLAFNDPPANFDSEDPYLIVQLDEACRRQQVGEGWFADMESVPSQAISMSIRQIMKADAILCSVPDLRKSEAVRNAVEGPVTPLVPASILQQHPNAYLVLDEASSSLLSKETLTKCQRFGGRLTE